MYLVVPAEPLIMQNAVFDYENAGDIPKEILEMPSDQKNGRYKLRRISFDLGYAKSKVYMPTYRNKVTPQPQPLEMLGRLKQRCSHQCIWGAIIFVGIFSFSIYRITF